MSLNEIGSLVKGASLGAGLAQGLAEEAAKTAMWLAGAGLDRGEVLSEALDRTADHWRRDRLFDACAACLDGRPDENGAASALCVGPLALDRLCLESPLHLGAVDLPVLLLALAAWRSRELGFGVVLHWTGIGSPVEAHCRDGSVALLAGDPGNLVSDRDRPITITRLADDAEMPVDDFAAARRAAIEQGVTLGEAARKRIEVHFLRSLVEATEASRLSGAGAGLVDRD